MIRHLIRHLITYGLAPLAGIYLALGIEHLPEITQALLYGGACVALGALLEGRRREAR